MDQTVIERADELPLLIYWLLHMQIEVIIDRVLPHPHPNRQGLSYGQLALVFVAYVVYTRNHRLYEMEGWVAEHTAVLSLSTGWSIGLKEATDDRLGDLLSALGTAEEQSMAVQRELGQHLVQAYQLPTAVGRYDTTTFNVEHAPTSQGQAAGGLLRFGHSKDRRPDLLQFKQGLATLDPAGVPIFTNTVAGNRADDPLYVPAWQQMKRTMGHSDFLFVADCKAGALNNRAEIDRAGGKYLFPLPLTGRVPDYLRAWVLQPPISPEPIVLVTGDDLNPTVVGEGFVVELGVYAPPGADQAQRHHWSEQWLVTRSYSLAQRQQAQLAQQLDQAEAALRRLNEKKFTTALELDQAAQVVLTQPAIKGLLSISITETVTIQVRYVGPGRPGPNRPQQVVTTRQAHLTVHRQQTAIEHRHQLAGWRIHVSNVPSAELTLTQAITYYRGEFILEHGFHRFKRGSLPVLPLFLQLPERIRGLMLLLLVALQLLTLLEFVAQRQLAQRQEPISGLIPGNPKMKTARPTAERLLAQFNGLHWLGQPTETGLSGQLVEPLTPLQQLILAILGVPETIYFLSGELHFHNCFDST